MNAIFFMEALTDIDAEFIDKATIQQKIKRYSFGRILLIAAVIAVLAASAFAVSETISWFIGYYGKEEGALSGEQIEYIEENTVQQYQEQDVEGWRVAVESTFSDGNFGIIKLRLTAPENVKLDAQSYRFQKELIPNDPAVKEPSSYSSGSYATNEDNVVDHVITVYGELTDETQWKLVLKNVWAGYVESTDEEYRHWEELVAIGTWTFDIVFSNDGNQELELLTESIMVIGDMGISEPVYARALITSIKLRTMSITIDYQNLDAPRAAIWFDGLSIVMKDGTTVGFREISGRRGGVLVMLKEPLVFADADYLLLPDGRKIPIT